MFPAGVAHPVERHLAKVEVASSSLVTRSIKSSLFLNKLLFLLSFIPKYHSPSLWNWGNLNTRILSHSSRQRLSPSNFVSAYDFMIYEYLHRRRPFLYSHSKSNLLTFIGRLQIVCER